MNRFRRLALSTVLSLAPTGALSCAGFQDECASGATRCEGNVAMSCEANCSDFGCVHHWKRTDCSDHTCSTLPNGISTCLESTSPDPRCGIANSTSYCTAEGRPAFCYLGYRLGTGQCPEASNDPEATRCVESTTGAATCVPPDAAPDAVCAGKDGYRCDGTTLVQCSAGLAVSKVACAVCTDTDGVFCGGFLGDGCRTSSDCAVGLSCHRDTAGTDRCTVACDGGVVVTRKLDAGARGSADAGHEAAAVTAGDSGIALTCDALFNAGAPSHTGPRVVIPPGTILGCIAGFCEWTR